MRRKQVSESVNKYALSWWTTFAEAKWFRYIKLIWGRLMVYIPFIIEALSGGETTPMSQWPKSKGRYKEQKGLTQASVGQAEHQHSAVTHFLTTTTPKTASISSHFLLCRCLRPPSGISFLLVPAPSPLLAPAPAPVLALLSPPGPMFGSVPNQSQRGKTVAFP